MPTRIKIQAAPLWTWNTNAVIIETIHPSSIASMKWPPGTPENPYADKYSLSADKDVIRISLTGQRGGKRGNVIFTKEQVQELISALSVMAQQL